MHNCTMLHICTSRSPPLVQTLLQCIFWVKHFSRATLMLHEFENIICFRFKSDICHCFNCLMYNCTYIQVQIQIHNTYPSTNTRASEMLGQQQRPIVLQFGRHPHPLHLYHPHTTPQPPHHSLCSVELCQIKMAFPPRDILTMTIITIMGEAAIWTQDRGKRRDWAGQDSNLFSAFCLRRQVRR